MVFTGLYMNTVEMELCETDEMERNETNYRFESNVVHRKTGFINWEQFFNF